MQYTRQQSYTPYNTVNGKRQGVLGPECSSVCQVDWKKIFQFIYFFHLSKVKHILMKFSSCLRCVHSLWKTLFQLMCIFDLCRKKSLCVKLGPYLRRVYSYPPGRHLTKHWSKIWRDKFASQKDCKMCGSLHGMLIGCSMLIINNGKLLHFAPTGDYVCQCKKIKIVPLSNKHFQWGFFRSWSSVFLIVWRSQSLPCDVSSHSFFLLRTHWKHLSSVSTNHWN